MTTKTLQSEKQTTKFETIKIYLVALCLIFTVQFVFAHTVDNRPESDAMYTSVAAAITVAIGGDMIQIYPSPTTDVADYSDGSHEIFIRFRV